MVGSLATGLAGSSTLPPQTARSSGTGWRPAQGTATGAGLMLPLGTSWRAEPAFAALREASGR